MNYGTCIYFQNLYIFVYLLYPKIHDHVYISVYLGTQGINLCISLYISSTEDPCISVLADAAAERYYKQCNLRPILSLVKDGAILSADEPINLVLSNMDEVLLYYLEV